MDCVHKLPTETLLAVTLSLLLTIAKMSSKSEFPQVTLTGRAASAKMVGHRIPTKKKKGGGDGVQPALCPQGWLLGGSAGGAQCPQLPPKSFHCF